MSLFDNFDRYSLIIGVPTMSITKNGVAFNKAAIHKLKSPSFVEIFINYDTKQFAIKTCDENNQNAQKFVSDKTSNKDVFTVRWNYKDLVKTISSIVDVDIFSDKGIKVEGEYITDENALLFDINNYSLI